VHVLVQADRIDGYSTDDGDWTDTRRYYITPDDDPDEVTSEVIEELGERDMGDPAELDEFLMWAHENYPAEQMALVFWNHGDSWTKDGGDSDLPDEMSMVSWDETSDSELSIAGGDVRLALENIVDARGPLEVVAFDACLMASWEVAHSLADQALFMAGSEAVVGEEGYVYGPALDVLRDVDADPDGADLAIELARGATEDGGEWSHSAIDLGALSDINDAVDALAELVLDDPGLEAPLLVVRADARGADFSYPNWYLDLGDLGRALVDSSVTEFQTAGEAIEDGVDTAVLSAYGNPPYAWTTGLTILFDFDWPSYLTDYSEGEGATWSQETLWDELILQYAGL
jgi:hypothetical protein